MKKFTNIGDKSSSLNESISNVDAEKLSIDGLIKTLSIEIEGTDSEVTADYTIKANDKFYEGIKTVINEMFHEEKVALLEKARINQYLNNIDWIDEEMDSIKESIKNK